MNPKVTRAAALVPFDAADYTWLDLSEAATPADDIKRLEDELAGVPISDLPLLFEKMAVLPPIAKWDDQTVITVHREGASIQITSFVLGKPECLFSAVATDVAQNDVSFEVEIDDSVQAKLCAEFGTEQAALDWIRGYLGSAMMFICYAAMVEAVKETYFCPSNPANEKRRRKKKLPLYEWKTIVIDPSEIKRVRDTVKSHKERERCREHEVRGHWAVRRKSGKRYWVRAHKRGDPSKGTVFHDYQLGE